MKVMKSIILSAVAALIVAAGPEVTAPLVGADNAAVAATKPKPAAAPKKCKPPKKLVTTAAGVTTCKLSKTKKARKCKVGMSLKTVVVKKDGVVVKNADGSDKTVTKCVKAKKAAPLKCKAPKVVRPAGTVIGKDFDTGADIKSVKPACVTPKKATKTTTP